jgi:class 3 adenylate cyclase/predicted ATPase
MRCPSCMAENVATRRFCAQCGTPLPVPCPACGFENEASANFCGGCGKPVGDVAAPEPAAASPAPRTDSAERRQLTVMFCDLVGSTALASRLDPEDLREVIGAYQKCVAETIVRFDGFIAKYMGDGVLAYFGYPQAHEDDAERAIRASLAVVEEVRRVASLEALQVRIGLATGLAVVGDLIGSGAAQEQSVIGETPNLAARLQAVAGRDEIVIPENTRRLVGSLFEYESLGEIKVKGLPARVPSFRVLGESQIGSRFEALRTGETPLIGRAEELELLHRRWAQAKAGSGQIVLISAEAGVGKSRLAEAFRQSLEKEPHTRLRYFCSPHHQDSALFPFIAQLERAAGFERDDTAAVRSEKLEALVATNAAEDGDVQLLAELLAVPFEDRYPAMDLTPRRKKEKTFEALLRQLVWLARRQSVLMIFEDLHWADPSSRELLDLTVEQIGRLPVLLIATFRPEFQPAWIGQPYVTALSLRRLGRDECEELVRGLVDNSTVLPSELLDEIVERTDGVPLFVEEMTKAVLEAGADHDQMSVSAVPSASLAVPATLNASLLGRLERLGSAAKHVAQVGAAIGRNFSYELIAATALLTEPELQDALCRLVGAGLVFQRGVPPAAEYLFKHALVQDTAYGTLLRSSRQRLHERIAAALRDQPETAERAPEVLAYHLAAAGQLESAAAHWLEAGRRAAARSANIEAIAHLRRGIGALGGIADTPQRAHRELALQLALGPALMSTRGHNAPEVELAYQRARRLSEQLGDDRARFASVWGVWLTRGSRSSRASRRELVNELFRAAERLGDRELFLEAHHAGWATDMSGAQYNSGREHVLKGLALYDPEQHRSHALTYGGHDPAVCGKGQGAMMLWLLGYPDQAVKEAREGIVLAETLTHVPSVGHALWFAATICQLRRDPPGVLDLAERLLAMAGEHGLGQSQAIGGIMHGWARAHLADIEEGLSELRRAVISHGGTHRSYYTAALAETELRAGYLERAMAALNDAAAISDELGETFWRAGMLCVEGDLVRARSADDPGAAEERYREAITIAQRQQAKSLELRAATRLARLWQEQNRAVEANDVLAPVYGWFTEGFDTPDLKEAKALLDELG